MAARKAGEPEALTMPPPRRSLEANIRLALVFVGLVAAIAAALLGGLVLAPLLTSAGLSGPWAIAAGTGAAIIITVAVMAIAVIMMRRR